MTSARDLIFNNSMTFSGKSYARMVGDFMHVMGQLPEKERVIPTHVFELGERLVDEELSEYDLALVKFRNAQTTENATELADAIADSIYVLLWSAIRYDLPIDACFLEVQRSNMAKVNPDGTVTKNEFGKVQKPAGWTPPDLFAIVSHHRDDANWDGGIQKHAPAAEKKDE